MTGPSRSTLAALAVATLLGAAGAAHADVGDPFDDPRLHVGFGMHAGGFSVGPVGGPAVGVHVDLGRQMGPLLVYGEYNLLSIGESSASEADPIRGVLHRVGAAARYHLTQFGGGTIPVKGGFWMEAGLGRQAITWDEGGILRRNDVSLGFGLQADFKIRRDERATFIGFYYAFRASIAHGPDADKMQPPTCAGPCDEPTAPSPYDLGLFFNLGLNWGR
jgi:hypothetical protein